MNLIKTLRLKFKYHDTKKFNSYPSEKKKMYLMQSEVLVAVSISISRRFGEMSVKFI